ncbi:MAG: fibronectin type III domain-containing protein, partial [Calditrichia bacterium]
MKRNSHISNAISLFAILFFSVCIQILFIAPAAYGANIDCGCNETGTYKSPSKGKAIEVKLQTTEQATSPNGIYLLTASGGGTGQVTIVISENKTGGAVLLNLSFPATEAGWGFSPDDHRFVIHYMSSASQHSYKLYDLRQRPAQMVKEQTITLGSGGSAQIRFSSHGVYLFYAALTGTNRTYLSVADTSGMMAYTNEFDFQPIPGDPDAKYGMATWGFSPDKEDRTLSYAFINGTNSFHLTAVNLSTQTVLTNEDILNSVSSFWQFSPCGDALGLLVQTSQSQMQIRLIKTETGSSLYNNTFSFGSVEFLSTEQSQIARISGNDYILAANTAIYPCADNQPPTWPADSQIDTSGLTETGITLTWNKAQDNTAVSGYKIYQDDSEIDEVADTTYTVSGLTPNTAYEFRIEAGDAAGNWSIDGPAVTITTLPPADSEAPTWPKDAVLGAIYAWSNGLTLEWYAADDNVGVVAYVIYENDVVVDSFSVQPDETPVDRRIGGLVLGTSYTFRVEAGDAGGNWSTDGPALSIVYDPDTPPSWPAESSLTIDSIGITEVKLHWTRAEAPISVNQYEIYANDRSYMSVRRPDDFSPADTTAIVDGLDPETAYTFRVEAYNENYYESSGGPEATATTLRDNVPPSWPEESILTDCDLQATHISLYWDPARDNVWVSAYRIFKNGILIAQIDMYTGPEYSKSIKSDNPYTFRVDSLEP